MEKMKNDPANLYVELIKKTLAFLLWPEPPTPLTTYNYQRGVLKRAAVSLVSRLLKIKNLQIVRDYAYSEDQRIEGRIWRQFADTMIGLKRLDNLHSCIESVIKEGISGDLIETGVWRGGACILMKAVLVARGITDRKVYVADSFEGLPLPDIKSFPADKSDSHYTHKALAISLDEVKNNFRRYDLLDDQVVFLKGWFKDTLPGATFRKLALMRLDGDMYGSTMEALTHLYPKLTPGGYCIIDDYAWPACKKAVDDFRTSYKIQAELNVIDWAGRFWRKE